MIQPHSPTLDLALVRRIERSAAATSATFAEALHRIDPSWRTQSFPLADGQAVLCGAGLYVNQAIALGLVEPVTDAHLDELAMRSREVGVPVAVEIGPATHEDLTVRCAERGLASTGDVSVLTLTGPTTAKRDETDVMTAECVIQAVGLEELVLWQAATALGWGHDTVERRRASDAFAAAVFQRHGEMLLLARAAVDGTVVGCASLTIYEGIAILGGMSTVPEARRRGVQRALVHHRLAVAAAAGCDLAVTTAEAGGDSARNLERLGFVPTYTKAVWRGNPT